MRREDRAKQFLPFDSLRGLREALKEKEEEHGRQPRRELSEEETQRIEETLAALSPGDEAEAVFYSGGYTLRVRGRVERIDPAGRTIRIGEGKIAFMDLYALEKTEDRSGR